MFLLCSNYEMDKATTRIETAPDASPATEAHFALLSALVTLAGEFARGFQEAGVAALKAGQFDQACKAETRFSRLFLAVRRGVALMARLEQERAEALQAAEQDRDDWQAEMAERRRQVADGVTHAIAAAEPDDADKRERLTSELWSRLSGDHPDRIDADLKDRALPIEALIRSLCRALGIRPDRAALAEAAERAVATPPPFRSARPLPDDPPDIDPPDTDPPDTDLSDTDPAAPSGGDTAAAEARRRETEAWRRLHAVLLLHRESG
jgi:hypothetical protein